MSHEKLQTVTNVARLKDEKNYYYYFQNVLHGKVS